MRFREGEPGREGAFELPEYLIPVLAPKSINASKLSVLISQCEQFENTAWLMFHIQFIYTPRR